MFYLLHSLGLGKQDPMARELKEHEASVQKSHHLQLKVTVPGSKNELLLGKWV